MPARAGRFSATTGPAGLKRGVFQQPQLPVEALANLLVATCAEPRAQLRRARELAHRIGERRDQLLGRLRLDQDAALAVEVVGGAAPIRRDHRQADRHGLEHHRPAALAQARQHQRVHLDQPRGQHGLGHEAMEAHALADPEPLGHRLQLQALETVAEDVERGIVLICHSRQR
jgi:hypothetical protein